MASKRSGDHTPTKRRDGRYFWMPAPGTLTPSVWKDHGDEVNLHRVCDHRYRWAAWLCAWVRNRGL